MALLDFLSKRHRALSTGARGLYAKAVAQARQPAFYAELGVPDTIDGRFDLLVLHVHLLCRRLGLDPEQAVFAQSLFDAMFHDMDRNLRELGVGDPSMGRRVKSMLEAYYGRIKAYDAALATGAPALESVVARNIYGSAEPPRAAAQLASYIRRTVAALDRVSPHALADGQFEFPPVVPPASGIG
jgi:cytochrome b pre-mRNA-processing protein 3